MRLCSQAIAGTGSVVMMVKVSKSAPEDQSTSPQPGKSEHFSGFFHHPVRDFAFFRGNHS